MKEKLITVNIPEATISFKGFKFTVKEKPDNYKESYNNELYNSTRDAIKIKRAPASLVFTLTTSRNKVVTSKFWTEPVCVSVDVPDDLRMLYTLKYPCTFEIPTFTAQLPAITYSVPDHGKASVNALTQGFNDQFEKALESLTKAMATFTIKITYNDSGYSKSALMNQVVPISFQPSYYSSAFEVKAEDLRMKEKGNVTWVPAFHTYYWSLMNSIATNNRRPILKFVEPTEVQPDWFFLNQHSDWMEQHKIHKLVAEGYVEFAIQYSPTLLKEFHREWGTVLDNEELQQYMSQVKAKVAGEYEWKDDSEGNSVKEYKKFKKEIVYGVWIKFTEKGKSFFERNTTKDFRVIHHLSGDPRKKIDELQLDCYGK